MRLVERDTLYGVCVLQRNIFQVFTQVNEKAMLHTEICFLQAIGVCLLKVRGQYGKFGCRELKYRLHLLKCLFVKCNYRTAKIYFKK